MLNAKPFAEKNIVKEVENDYDTCFDDAWEYGTSHGH
jgi:hypothetical protein